MARIFPKIAVAMGALACLIGAKPGSMIAPPVHRRFVLIFRCAPAAWTNPAQGQRKEQIRLFVRMFCQARRRVGQNSTGSNASSASPWVREDCRNRQVIVSLATGLCLAAFVRAPPSLLCRFWFCSIINANPMDWMSVVHIITCITQLTPGDSEGQHRVI
ncbi:hypothetical protein WG908_02640 [Sphingobium sp. AN641]|uniref:hypothetical protein n=1 Tax=Sphingobium sp. AN641 TaxID=3133443 RepID=UPI0030BA3E2B